MKPPLITLTDYPKRQMIEAHYRGIETDVLQKIRMQLFHTMMTSMIEYAAGYNVLYDFKAIERELEFRDGPLNEL